MAQPASRISFFSSFADYVRQRRDAIGRTSMELVRESPDVPGAAHISPDALQDRVPELMDHLVEHLGVKKEGMKERAVKHSRTHGRELWKAGYNISELIWEIYIIRRVLTQTVLSEFAREHPEHSTRPKRRQLSRPFR